MYFEDGAVVRDQNGDSPGRYGDACFDTFAFGLSWFRVNKEYHPLIDHRNFITPTGSVRHKKAIWRQNDMTEDNEKPLYMFLRETQNESDRQFIADRCWDDLKTGNMKVLTPGYVAELLNSQVLRCICLVFQALFFLLPYWDDGAWKNGKWPIGWLSKTDGFLMWALNAYLAPWPFRKIIPKKILKKKIGAYYKPEYDAVDNEAMQDTHFQSTMWILTTHYKMVDSL